MLEMLECWLIFALNILDVYHNTEEIIHAYNSKQFKAWKSSNPPNDYWL